jgi:hypothetical protein
MIPCDLHVAQWDRAFHLRDTQSLERRDEAPDQATSERTLQAVDEKRKLPERGRSIKEPTSRLPRAGYTSPWSWTCL